jgi:quercetin dioxygenase-like cupin family protein
MPLAVYDYRTDVANLLVTPQIRARFMRLEPGAVAAAHSHDLGQEIFLVLSGRAEFTIDGAVAEVGPGQLCIALIDQVHSVRALGEEPMVMYLSVTPHIQPTHTFWGTDGEPLPHRFVPSAAYDHTTDAATPLDELLDRLRAATSALRDAAENAAAVQSRRSGELTRAIASGDLDGADEQRGLIWDALLGVFRQSADLAAIWNDIAPRAGRT